MGGTLTSRRVPDPGPLVPPVSFAGAGWGTRWSVVGLGRARCWVLRERLVGFLGVWPVLCLVWWVAGRCLRTAQWTRASVAKFLRAHGGCLGTRNR